ncbi:MAG: PilC/PilY family type IV pilus protein [Oxalobacteraceae bacterium]|nr:PilC/PilY family type IV pilus protein [Oxalobacteraceae bacterium]
MNAQKRNFLTALVLLPTMLGLMTVFAAASFDPDTQPIGYVGQPAVTSNIVTSGSERLYAIDYSSVDWTGNLHSYQLSGAGAISDLDDWDGGAAEQLDAQNPDTARKIVTWSGSAGIPFRWNSLSTGAASQQTDLGSSAVLDYIRGVRTNETTNGGTFRPRNSVLGDIIHSTPVYWNDGTNQTVFVGANDGMLHAFNADDGTERFAYVPSILIPKLSALTNVSYIHKYFVDGRLAIRKFGSQTILAGALGAGGKGLFGLDVTNTAASSETDAASRILWEITNTGINSTDSAAHSPTSTDFANLGYAYGAPTLLTLPGGTSALIVGNGYNSTVGTASLFLIDPVTGALIEEIDTDSGSSGSPNGLSSPSFWDSNGDGKMDIAYAGDIDGNLWKFSLVSPYAVSLLHTTSPAQAITMAPGIKAHPLGGQMVTFVTGRMLTAADQTDTATHAAYGIWDGAPVGNVTLLAQTLTEATYTGVTPSVRVRTASNTAPDWDLHKGWKTALPIGGERVVGDGAYVTGSAFMFMSTNPTVSPNTAPPGENWWMQLNALTGGDNGVVLFDLNKDGAFTAADQVGSSLNPVGRNMGGGVRSQLIALSASGFDVYQANYDKNGAAPPVTTGDDRGVAGGHFDQDMYYGANLTTPGRKGLQSVTHIHEYDDMYDVTGVNMLDASRTEFDLANAIPSTSTAFKVLAQNQYLSPAAKIHIHGSPSYVYNVDQGYTPIKNFITSATLDLTTDVPTYTRANIDSLAINMPVDAFAPKDWWGGALGLPADVRVGLHPTETSCVRWGGDTGNMFKPVIPPSSVTTSGNGTSSTTTGVRHNGALVIQIIKDTTPNSAIEMSVPNHPEYGWRVTSANFGTYVLAEYTTFWHDGVCYGEAGWSKVLAMDTKTCGANETATTKICKVSESSASGTDPHIGSFGSGDGSTTTGSTTTTVVTNADGSITITVVVTNADGTTTTTVTTVTPGIETGGAVNSSGAINANGEIGGQLPFGRINWRELQQ